MTASDSSRDRNLHRSDTIRIRFSVPILLGAILLQALVVTLPAWPVDAIIAGALLGSAWLLAGRPATALTLRGILILTLPVLLIRVITDPEPDAVVSWISYVSRLVSAAMIALTLLARGGTRLILNGIDWLVTVIPGRVRRDVRDVIRSSIYLLPLVLRRLRLALGAGRLRYAHTRRGTWFVRPLRAVFVSLTAVPRARAEAMLVRGILEDHRR